MIRISGLDPAGLKYSFFNKYILFTIYIYICSLKGPLFENENELVRLDPSDAIFVDIYHTNGGSLINAKYNYYRLLKNIYFV